MSKIVKCPIYGFIPIPDLCLPFINTLSFQRLDRIKQLGACIKVFPSASHTRKEHSLGVMYLAGIVIDQLRKFVPITDREKELVQLSALYHDIGHSAYSHLFDDFLEAVDITNQTDPFFQLKHHEDRSIYFLKKENTELELLSQEEIEFVQNIILGRKPESDPRYYLYEIVNNAFCGIDVDKMDYLRRDAYHTGFPNFQYMYIISCMLIDNENHIVFKSKARMDIEDLFVTRYRMFKQVYHHHTVQKICRIYKCAMRRLGPKLFVCGEMTDDMNIETLLRFSEETSDLINDIDRRKFNHVCDVCQDFELDVGVKTSGSVEKVKFV